MHKRRVLVNEFTYTQKDSMNQVKKYLKPDIRGNKKSGKRIAEKQLREKFGMINF